MRKEHKQLDANIFEGINAIIRTDEAKHLVLSAVVGTSEYKRNFH